MRPSFFVAQLRGLGKIICKSLSRPHSSETVLFIHRFHTSPYSGVRDYFSELVTLKEQEENGTAFRGGTTTDRSKLGEGASAGAGGDKTAAAGRGGRGLKGCTGRLELRPVGCAAGNALEQRKVSSDMVP